MDGFSAIIIVLGVISALYAGYLMGGMDYVGVWLKNQSEHTKRFTARRRFFNTSRVLTYVTLVTSCCIGIITLLKGFIELSFYSGLVSFAFWVSLIAIGVLITVFRETFRPYYERKPKPKAVRKGIPFHSLLRLYVFTVKTQVEEDVRIATEPFWTPRLFTVVDWFCRHSWQFALFTPILGWCALLNAATYVYGRDVQPNM